MVYFAALSKNWNAPLPYLFFSLSPPTSDSLNISIMVSDLSGPQSRRFTAFPYASVCCSPYSTLTLIVPLCKQYLCASLTVSLLTRSFLSCRSIILCSHSPPLASADLPLCALRLSFSLCRQNMYAYLWICSSIREFDFDVHRSVIWSCVVFISPELRNLINGGCVLNGQLLTVRFSQFFCFVFALGIFFSTADRVCFVYSFVLSLTSVLAPNICFPLDASPSSAGGFYRIICEVPVGRNNCLQATGRLSCTQLNVLRSNSSVSIHTEDFLQQRSYFILSCAFVYPSFSVGLSENKQTKRMLLQLIVIPWNRNASSVFFCFFVLERNYLSRLWHRWRRGERWK